MPITVKGTEIAELNLGDSNVEQAYIEGVLVYLEAEPPSLPRNVMARTDFASRSQTITATWDAPASDGGRPITGYDIELRNQGVWFRTRNLPSSARRWTDTLNLSAYDRFRVRAVNIVGNGDWADVGVAVRLQ